MSASTAPEHLSATPSEGEAKALTVRGAAVLGIGSMIGAGILLGYVCAKLGMRSPRPED